MITSVNDGWKTDSSSYFVVPEPLSFNTLTATDVAFLARPYVLDITVPVSGRGVECECVDVREWAGGELLYLPPTTMHSSTLIPSPHPGMRLAYQNIL